ncbi:hypothetical protein KEM54_002575 [Ascosphaera aggregata]|nr:hypothetical protein KEM54_002575 [Ascosphaera aggregata]
MPHYIRFLKPPQQICDDCGHVNVSCLITITNDLGDQFLWQATPLIAVLLLIDANHGLIPLVKKELVWESGRRDVKITFGPVKPKSQSSYSFRVHVAMVSKAGTTACHLTESEVVPITAAWSGEFGGCADAKAEKLVERKFLPAVGPALAIWEETGESIARHLWDAALATVVALEKMVRERCWLECLTASFTRNINDRKQSRKNLQVIELGTGCGMVGIYIAQTFPRVSVLLTDLEDAREVVELNLSQSRAARESSATFQVLDWNEDLPVNVRQMRPDLVIVSDCTYNEDSFTALTQTLSRLADTSPELLILVTYKERHQSEKAFFEGMLDRGFEVRGRSTIALPDLTADGRQQVVQLLAFARDHAVLVHQEGIQ